MMFVNAEFFSPYVTDALRDGIGTVFAKEGEDD
jgi:hypothetical protein